MPQGLSRIKQINQENAAKRAAYEEGKGGIRYLDLKDGDIATVRFLEQGDEVFFIWVHDLPKRPGEAFPQKTPCLDQEDQGNACAACERGIKRRSQVIITCIWFNAPKFQRDKDNKIIKGNDNRPVVIGNEDTVAVWKTGPTNGGRLEYLDSSHGGLTRGIYKIKREGSTKDNTTYHIDFAEQRDPTPAEFELSKDKPNPNTVLPVLSYGDMARVYSGGGPVQQPDGNGQSTGPLPPAAGPTGNAFADASRSPINRGAFGN